MLRRVSFYALTVLLLTLILSALASAQNEKKIVYAVLIDNTRSLETQFPQVRALAKGVVTQINQRGSISLFSFMAQGDKRHTLAVVTWGVEWSQDRRLLDTYIDNLRIEAGQTTLLDAIHSIAEKLNAKASFDKNAFADKVMILITDGEDRVSKVKEKELIKELKESGIKVCAIGLIQALDEYGGIIVKSPKETAIGFLKKITKETGGVVIFPKSN